MPDGCKMHPKLVAASGHRRQPQPGNITLPRYHLPACQRRTPGGAAYLLQRSVRPICDQRQINLAATCLGLPPDIGDISLFDPSPLKLQTKMPLRRPVKREHHNPRRIHIQPMHQQRRRERQSDPTFQTIAMLSRLAWHRQQTRRLVDQHDRLILIKNGQRHLGRPIGKLCVHLAAQTLQSTIKPLGAQITLPCKAGPA